ncbi:MAG: hypothetical protein JWO43_560 [Candidatus Adlerbacteria bacterium]|nr:hypothetical protein [Candidatus Adlerbacteria bacterium]
MADRQLYTIGRMHDRRHNYYFLEHGGEGSFHQTVPELVRAIGEKIEKWSSIKIKFYENTMIRFQKLGESEHELERRMPLNASDQEQVWEGLLQQINAS